MTSFHLALAALAVAAVALLLRPWWPGRRIAGADSAAALNAAIHRDRLAELERDRASGILAEADFIEARDELQRQLLDDVGGDAASVGEAAGGGARASGIALALLVPALAVALYAWLGRPDTALPEAVQRHRAEAEMEKTVAGLAAKLEHNPDNPEGWAMLARSYRSLGRLADAERAYGRIGPDFTGNAQYAAELAELLVQGEQGFSPRAKELVALALRLEPDNMLALFLGGGEALESGRHAHAVALWERLLPRLEPGGEDARMIESGIAMARELSAARPGVGAGGTAKGKAAQSAASPAGKAASAVGGRVELSPALRDKAAPTDTVFIFARAVDGPRMPLAAQRARVADLPLDFVLDDGQALVSGATLSAARQVRVEVRISKSGQATPTAGDLTGQSAAVTPGAKHLRIVVDRVEP